MSGERDSDITPNFKHKNLPKKISPFSKEIMSLFVMQKAIDLEEVSDHQMLKM